MKNAMLVGYGKMGKMIESILTSSGQWQIAGMVDAGLFASPLDVPGKIDAIFDFSYPGNLPDVLECARRSGCALILGTTGYSEDDLAKIRGAAKYAPIIQTYNYSQGVAAVREAAAMLARALSGFDVEIVETHHNQKADAPSGTAKMLLSAIDPGGERPVIYGREGRPGPRGNEIGVHALRGGTVAGEHSVFFFGGDETVEIKHSAQSRGIFARGAVRAAEFLVGRAPGLYGMDDVMRGA